VALDAITGALKWNFTTGGPVYASPAVYSGTVYVTSYDKKLYAIDSTTGAEKWNVSFLTSSDSSPALYNGIVYAGDKSGLVHAIYTSNHSTAWTFDTQLGDVPSSPAILGDKLYISSYPNQTMFSLYVSNGSKAWDKVLKGKVEASAGVHNGHVFITTTDGVVYSLNATTGSTVWNFTVPSVNNKIFSSPTLADGKVIFGSEDGFVYVLDEATGKMVWRYETTAVMDSSPTLYKGYMVIGGNDHLLYVLGPDNEPPKVTMTDPKNGSTGVSVATKITMTFSEQINATSATGGFAIDPPTTFDVSWDTTGTIATLNASLKPNTMYNVTAKKTLKDMHANSMGKDYVLTFTTQDVINPLVVSTKPANGDVEVPLDSMINITFSKPMDRPSSENAFNSMPSLTGTFSWSAGDTVMSFAANPRLEGDTWYDVTISTNAQDKIGNPMLVPFNFKFHSYDNVGPKIVSTSPKNNDVNVSLSANVVITFHEPVNETSANAGISFSPTVAYAATFSGSVMTMTHSVPFTGDTLYTVTVSKVKDIKGNIGLTSTFKFKIIDNIPPTITDVSPANGSKDVSTNTKMMISFSEPMDRAAVESAISFDPKISNDPNVTFLAKWDTMSKSVTITPGAILAECTTYHVSISKGAKDLSGNPLASVFSTEFKTAGTCPNQNNNQDTIGVLWSALQQWWWVLLIIFIVIMVLAIMIPGRKTLLMFYGVDEEELKEEKKKKADEENRCEICYGSLEDEPWIKCKECDKPSHEKCIKKLGKCAYCKAPYGTGETPSETVTETITEEKVEEKTEEKKEEGK
jgi:outer membrane protein assembly factor BamB